MSTVDANNPDVFEHKFSGWSVWLESDNDAVADETNKLVEDCGGTEAGVHPFVPHITLLYDFPPQSNPDDQEQVLIDIKESLQLPSLTLRPTDFCFFHYPKMADDGKGFGCVISMILFEKSEWLTQLQSKVKESFPQDERQAKFTPHMSLVYAPESTADWLGNYTKKVLERKKKYLLEPFAARYLSVWSTEGNIDEWFRIARVELEEASDDTEQTGAIDQPTTEDADD